VAPAACARVRRASGLCDARASWAGKDMEAAWEQNWKGLQFFITFTAVTTIFSKFLPKEPKEIVDTRRTEKEKKAKEKEARDAMSRRPDARAHARTHTLQHMRAREHVRTRTFVPSRRPATRPLPAHVHICLGFRGSGLEFSRAKSRPPRAYPSK
jgi:hypothetical protein